MNTSQVPRSIAMKVGLFTFGGLMLVAGVSFFVNDRPFWWRGCQLVKINVDDATGLKAKSSIRSLGIEIGFLKSVELSETSVTLGICITAPVEVLSDTRAYIRGEGFLGDKFVELKPVRYVGGAHPGAAVNAPADTLPAGEKPAGSGENKTPRKGAENEGGAGYRLLPPTAAWGGIVRLLSAVTGAVVESAEAQESAAVAQGAPREIPVGEKQGDMQAVISRVDKLVQEVTGLTKNLKDGIDPEELRQTMKQLNKTLENASKTLGPEGGINQTAQRSLLKLEDAIEQIRDQATRINQGKGSVGMLLNDPAYADELKKALQNLNKLLGRASDIRFVVDVGGEEIHGYDGGRAWFRLQIWPAPTRYYLIGVSVDPRGRLTQSTTTTTVSGQSTVVSTQVNEPTGLLINAMLGRIFFSRLDLAIGVLYGDGAISISPMWGPTGKEDMIRTQFDVYSRVVSAKLDARARLMLKPFMGNKFLAPLNFNAGLESVRSLNKYVEYSYGVGITFDDEDIKLLFSLK